MSQPGQTCRCRATSRWKNNLEEETTERETEPAVAVAATPAEDAEMIHRVTMVEGVVHAEEWP